MRHWRGACVAALTALLCGCASAPPGSHYPKEVTKAFDRPLDTRLGERFHVLSTANGGRSGFRLFPVGVDGFALRLQMVRAAARAVDLQYYLLEEDVTGRLLIDALLRAADRGVRVRLLLDDLDALGRDDLIGSLDAHPNIEVRVFNPFRYRGSIEFIRDAEFLFNSARLDYRMHNKLFVVDDSVAVAGGRNVGDAYFQLSPRQQFGDYDIFASGPIVSALSVSFDAYWNSALAIPLQALRGHRSGEESGEALARYRALLDQQLQHVRETDSGLLRRVHDGEPLRSLERGQSLVWTGAQVLYDSPDKKKVEGGNEDGRLMQGALDAAAEHTTGELLMITPFLVPGQDGMGLLERLRKRNVSVGIVTNSLESNPETVAHSGYLHYRTRLLEDGIALHEVRAKPAGGGAGDPLRAPRPTPFGLHGKAYVFDRRQVYIGSMNFDQRSLHLNTELGLLIDSPVLARQVASEYEALAAPQNSYTVVVEDGKSSPPRLGWVTTVDGRLKTLDEEPGTVWRRLDAGLLSVLPLDSQL